MTVNSSLQSPSDTSTRTLRIGYGLAIIAAVIIWLLIGQYLASPATDPFNAQLDVSFYLREGQQIRNGGPFAFDSAVHAYGYPLFVAVCLTLADIFQQPVNTVVTVLQFLLHLAASGLALGLFTRMSDTPPSARTRIGVFFALVCNPLLLTPTHYMLSDSVTVFWLTLMLAAGLSTWRGRWWIVGLALGLCIVTRPYHQIWIIILVIALLATLTFFRWVQRYAVYVNSRQVGRTLLQILVPVLLIVGLQYLITYQRHGVWSIVGGTGNKAIQIHITGSLYYYRYETLLKPDGLAAGIRYLNTTIQRQIAPIALEEPSMVALYLEQIRVDPISLPLMALMKVIGLFQHYDWRLFLLNLGIESPLAFVVGLWLFITFVAVIQSGFLEGIRLIRKRPRSLKLTPPIVLFWVTITYVVLYAIATAPEPRFIFPLFPSLTILGAYLMNQPRPRWQRISAAVIGLALYAIAAAIILPAAIISMD